MRLTVTTLVAVFVMSLSQVMAHDEGHGPKLTDQPKNGGTVMPVIAAKEANRGSKAQLLYKSELVRASDGTVQLYLYDEKMTPLDLNQFSQTAVAKIGPMRRNPKWKTESFELKTKNNQFVGKMPQIKVKPYYIDMTFTKGDQKLLTAFENLD